ncbi:oligopeptide/dipeptide ABC transporter ATP-binding protein, partial [Mycoplasma sp. ATU-Cv-703]
PRHPYTWALLSALPDQSEDKLDSIPGRPPSLEHLPAGDPFAARNPYALEVDFRVEPPLIPISKTHAAASWLLHPKAPKVTLPPRVKKIMLQFKRVFSRQKKSGGSHGS